MSMSERSHTRLTSVIDNKKFEHGQCKDKYVCDYYCQKNKCEKDGKHEYKHDGKCYPKYH